MLWYMCGPTVYDASHMGHGEASFTRQKAARVVLKFPEDVPVLTPEGFLVLPQGSR